MWTKCFINLKIENKFICLESIVICELIPGALAFKLCSQKLCKEDSYNITKTRRRKKWLTLLMLR